MISFLILILRPFSINSRTGEIIASGQGIEAEAMFRAFERFTANRAAYFSDALGTFCTLRAQNPAAAAAAISAQRKADMMALGALVALMITGGWRPGSLEPLFIYFLVYDCNFDCLTPDIVEEWHPDLAHLIRRWIQVGPDGNITPFEGHLISYHEIQVSLDTHILRSHLLTSCLQQPSALVDRDASTHSAYAAVFLARAIIGAEDIRHPELAAFIEGFALPCPARGFTMQRVSIIVILWS